MLAQVREPDFASAHRVDPSRIALIGHSMGGFAALMVASEHDDVECAVSLAGANLGLLATALADPAQAARVAENFQRWGGGPDSAASPARR